MDPILWALVTEGDAIYADSASARKAGTSTAIHIDQVMSWLERSTEYISNVRPELISQVLRCRATDAFETVAAAVFRMLTILKSINATTSPSQSTDDAKVSPGLEGEPPEVVKWVIFLWRNFGKHPGWASLTLVVILIVGAIELGPHVIPYLQHPLLILEEDVVRFAPSPALNHSTEIELQNAAKLYVAYLKRLGLPPKTIPTIYVKDQLGDSRTSYLRGNDIFLLSDHAVPTSLLHEYGHTILFEPIPGNDDAQWMYSAIEAGVDNYLTADGLSSPSLMDSINLEQRTSMSDIPHTFQGGQSVGGMAWGSFLWALRNHFDRDKATHAIVRAWSAVHPVSPPQDYQDVFINELVSAGLDSKVVNDTLKLWNTP